MQMIYLTCAPWIVTFSNLENPYLKLINFLHIYDLKPILLLRQAQASKINILVGSADLLFSIGRYLSNALTLVH